MKAFLYDILTHASRWVLWPTKFFSPKMKKFVEGREETFTLLEEKLGNGSKNIVWFHCASLGEFEQGVPIMKALKNQNKDIILLITFFSPSGFEVKKNTPLADLVTYLPLDTKTNAIRFINLVGPKMAIFVKYEIWPNYLFECQKQKIPTYLISGLFRKEQVYFKKYGGFMRNALFCFDHIFLQNQASEDLLKSIGYQHTSVSGDTRFDRVSQQIEEDNSLEFMKAFKQDNLCLVCGSTWPEDDAMIGPFINSLPKGVKIVMAPHVIDEDKIDKLMASSIHQVVKLSETTTTSLEEAKILIINSVGLLPKVYSYADIAYVGGAMGKKGLHNILEPATFGIPIIIGKYFDEFPEAIKLRELAGLYSVENKEQFSSLMHKFLSDEKFRLQTGMIAGHFVNRNTGATQKIMEKLAF